MARPLKQGLDYYPMDVGFLRDIKVRRIIKSCGASSIAVLIWLLNSCYQDEGYYLRWTKDLPFIVAEDTDVTEGHVQEVVKKALQVGFFDESMKDNYEILTSAGIQKRFLAVTSRRKSVFLRRDFALISINDDNNLVNVCNNSINVCNSTQSKVKESKVKKSIRDMSHDVIDDSVSTTTKTTTTKNNSSISSKKFRKPTLDELIAYIKEKGYVFDPEAFMSYYDANGWRVGGNPMKSWEAACAYWNKNEKSLKGKKLVQGSQSLSREDLDIIKDF